MRRRSWLFRLEGVVRADEHLLGAQLGNDWVEPVVIGLYPAGHQPIDSTDAVVGELGFR